MNAQSKLITTAILSALGGGVIIGAWTIYPHARAATRGRANSPITRCRRRGGRHRRRAVRRRDAHGGDRPQAGPGDDACAGARVTDKLMAEWQRKHPGEKWDDGAGRRDQPTPGTAEPAAGSLWQRIRATSAGQAPRSKEPSSRANRAYLRGFHERDDMVWKAETEASSRGQRDLPRRQAARRHHRHQLRHVPSQRRQHASRDLPEVPGAARRVALLRDMINWCIENPVKGKALARTTRPCARSRRTSWRSAKALRSTTGNIERAPHRRSIARIRDTLVDSRTYREHPRGCSLIFIPSADQLDSPMNRGQKRTRMKSIVQRYQSRHRPRANL